MSRSPANIAADGPLRRSEDRTRFGATERSCVCCVVTGRSDATSFVAADDGDEKANAAQTAAIRQ